MFGMQGVRALECFVVRRKAKDARMKVACSGREPFAVKRHIFAYSVYHCCQIYALNSTVVSSLEGASIAGRTWSTDSGILMAIEEFTSLNLRFIGSH